jgi:hypothetical protein
MRTSVPGSKASLIARLFTGDDGAQPPDGGSNRGLGGRHRQMLLTQLLRRPQVPQLSVPPQPSEAVPQLKPREEQVFGVQEPLHTLLTQLWPAGQEPQLSAPPQPSPTVPQFLPRLAQVFGVHGSVQVLFVQVWPAGQEPQLSVPPQPSPMVPQLPVMQTAGTQAVLM